MLEELDGLFLNATKAFGKPGAEYYDAAQKFFQR